jgi:hypothetical protein
MTIELTCGHPAHDELPLRLGASYYCPRCDFYRSSVEVPDEPPAHDDNLPKKTVTFEVVAGSIALPTDSAARKEIPMVRGLLDYFPSALAAVAAVSKKGNDQHNPGEPMHHARGKSMDHADCIVRHLVDRGTVDTDGVRHSAKVAWRALALLQEELEREAGAPFPRGAKR